jgi:translation initiation factor 2 alpha subunit (eIF-2alpha)
MEFDYQRQKVLAFWRRETKKKLIEAVYQKVTAPYQEAIDTIIKKHYATFGLGPQPFVTFKGKLLFFQDKETHMRRLSGQKNLYTLSRDFHSEMSEALKNKEAALQKIDKHKVSAYLDTALSHSQNHEDIQKLTPKFLHGYIPESSVEAKLTEETAKKLKEFHENEFKTLEEQLVMNLILN